MSDQTDNIYNLLKPFGISKDEGTIYLHLLQKGDQTALMISKDLHLARTKVYRILDNLISKQLVEQQIHTRGLRFGATHPSKFAVLLKEKEHELQLLRESLPQIIGHLEKKATTHNQSKILYYQGVEGVKQITYNSTKAKGELLTYESATDFSFLPEQFAEEMCREFVGNKIQVKQLTWQKKINAWTKVTDFPLHFWQARFIDPQQFSTSFETLLYNDVYALYAWQGDEIFGVEIHNQELVNMQKGIFNFIWNQAKPFTLINEFGKAVA